jgi:hypothetical protein
MAGLPCYATPRALDKRWREDFAPTAHKAIFGPDAKDLATRLQAHVRGFCRSYATCSGDDDTMCSAPEGHVT